MVINGKLSPNLTLSLSHITPWLSSPTARLLGPLWPFALESGSRSCRELRPATGMPFQARLPSTMEQQTLGLFTPLPSQGGERPRARASDGQTDRKRPRHVRLFVRMFSTVIKTAPEASRFVSDDRRACDLSDFPSKIHKNLLWQQRVWKTFPSLVVAPPQRSSLSQSITSPSRPLTSRRWRDFHLAAISLLAAVLQLARGTSV